MITKNSKSKKRPRPKKPLPVCDSDLENLVESGLTRDTIRQNELETVTDPNVLCKILNYKTTNSQACKGGLVIPYRDLRTGEVNCFARVRPHRPRTKKGKPIKYEQPKDEPLRAYYPAESIELINDGKSDLHITEGEKKALALAQLGLAAIGLGGVNCGLTDGELIDDLAQVEWAGRIVYIAFDFDPKKSTRTNVSIARSQLAKHLVNSGAKEVFDVQLPPAADGGKQGVDDFITANGSEAYFELVANARPVDAATDPKPDANTSIYLISSPPPTLGEAAYIGFAGDFIKAVADYTEAVDAAILAHLLPAVGTMIGDEPYVFGGDRQPCRLNTAVVGPTSSGRKGTSLVPVKILMKSVDAEFWAEQFVSGLSSGEGLIAKVSDKRQKNDDGKVETVTTEKRLYVVEPEFSKVLMQTRREGNILSPVMRECYDSGNLAVLTRNPLTATDAHISITGHITPEELRKRLTEIEMANGFGNRFLWFFVQSDKVMPDGEPIPPKIVKQFEQQLHSILRFTKGQKRLKRDTAANKLWREVYAELRKDRPGLQGAMMARGESIVLRLSLIYALLCKSNTITCEHIQAAMAVWHYSVDSINTLFMQKTGTDLADKIVKLLDDNGPMATTEFHKHMNVKSSTLKATMQMLVEQGMIESEKKSRSGPGRPTETWRRVPAN